MEFLVAGLILALLFFGAIFLFDNKLGKIAGIIVSVIGVILIVAAIIALAGIVRVFLLAIGIFLLIAGLMLCFKCEKITATNILGLIFIGISFMPAFLVYAIDADYINLPAKSCDCIVCKYDNNADKSDITTVNDDSIIPAKLIRHSKHDPCKSCQEHRTAACLVLLIASLELFIIGLILTFSQACHHKVHKE